MLAHLWRRFSAHFDGYLMLGLLTLMAVGLITLYSASTRDMDRLMGQVTNMSVALVAMWLVANIAPQNLARLAVPLYLVGLGLLVGVALFGVVINGARRWLDIGIAQIQPSELMKIGVPLALAWYFGKREATLNLFDFIAAFIILIIPVGLVMRQPDLGTSLLIASSGFFVLFFAGLSWRVIAGLAVVVAASLPVAWSLMHEYQRTRVLTLIDPAQDPLGAGYHTLQAMIAIGSGGLTGKGWLSGTQSHLDFLPERSTDFIFAVFSEEFGLVGNLLLLLLFFLITSRGFFIAMHAPTLFSRVLAGSITLTFFIYAFVNMGMVSGILPVVGVPLPLISYGGTSMVTLLIGFGILMSIATHKKLVQT